MTINEILAEIHIRGLEIDVLRYLQDWLIEDRKRIKEQASEARATVKATRKMALNGISNKAALEAIENLCEEE